jgi:prepilin-type N-terminal cleavage/methylation domain-containing protein
MTGGRMRTKKCQNGFSLLEIIVVLAILTIVMGVLFAAMTKVQKRYRVEDEKVDSMQSAREMVDQISRDIRNSGYPNARMYGTNPAITSSTLAAGLVAVSRTGILFEGDLDNTGTIQSVRYRTTPGAGGNCPCTLERSSGDKVNGTAPEAQAEAYTTMVNGVVNSTGAGGWTISGNTPTGASKDAVYATYKNDPVFRIFDRNGNEITTLPDTLGSMGNAMAAAANVRTVVVTMSVMSPDIDMETKLQPVVTLQTSVVVPNR